MAAYGLVGGPPHQDALAIGHNVFRAHIGGIHPRQRKDGLDEGLEGGQDDALPEGAQFEKGKQCEQVVPLALGVRYQGGYQGRLWHGIGVQEEEPCALRDGGGLLAGMAFAGPARRERLALDNMHVRVVGRIALRNVGGCVGGAVVNHYHFVGVVGLVQGSIQAAPDRTRFVAGRYEQGHQRPLAPGVARGGRQVGQGVQA